MMTDNREAYETISWILDNADMGFFIITAPSYMQKKLAELYKTSKVEIYDYAQNAGSYSFSELSAWADSHQAVDFYFILNMQLAIKDENDMLTLNLSRDMLSKKHKAWFFFMTKDLDDRLSAFAFDIYSYVRLKVHFSQESDKSINSQNKIDIKKYINFNNAKEAVARYGDLEKQLISLPINDTPDNQLISAAVTLSNIAKLYINCAEYENALRLLDIVKEIREEKIGAWHPETANTYSTIAEVYESQADYSKALEWYQKALEIREKKLGNKHPSTASAFNDIALIFSQQGHYTKALELYQKVLAIREQTLGKGHPDTAATFICLGYFYYRQDEYAKALKWYQMALEIYENALGRDHPDTATTYNSIAMVYDCLGDYAEAMNWYDKALAISEKVFGKDHPFTAAIYNNSALVCCRQGNCANAMERYLESYKTLLCTLGSDHPDTLMVKTNFETAYSKAGYKEPFENFWERKAGEVCIS